LKNEANIRYPIDVFSEIKSSNGGATVMLAKKIPAIMEIGTTI